jgi:hypothetical protein
LRIKSPAVAAGLFLVCEFDGDYRATRRNSAIRSSNIASTLDVASGKKWPKAAQFANRLPRALAIINGRQRRVVLFCQIRQD